MCHDSGEMPVVTAYGGYSQMRVAAQKATNGLANGMMRQRAAQRGHRRRAGSGPAHNRAC
jgi:hypothetical protein